MISDTDFAHAPPGGRWQAKSLGNAIVLLLAFSIVMYSLLTLLFLARGSDIDELGLFNPVYMKLYYGRMTYPIYGHFNAMFVHPPVRYSEIALLMRLGFSLPYAEGLMVCIIASLIAFVIAFGRFNLPCKLGLFFGVFTALVWMASIHQRTYGLRPETQIGLAWFLGLILLEDGKARDWELKRLFIGTFAITYASGLHYYAAPAFLGAAVYLMAARKHLSSSRFRSVAASIIAGGCLFGLPYLLFFVIPEFRQIIQFTGQVQQAGNWYSPILKHFEQYTWWRLNSGPAAIGPRLYYMIYPVLYTKVPAFCLGAVLLCLQKQTRLIAAASLPLCLFVFAYSQGKSAGYYLPEVIIFFCGVGVAAATGLEHLTARTLPVASRSATAIILAALIFATTISDIRNLSWVRPSWKPLIAEMDVARACAKEIVGPNALVGGRIGLWYISGASHWFDVAPDLLWRKDISDINLPDYFRRFDYIAEHNHMSNTTVNSRLESLPSWYVSGLLRLHGFFFADRHDNLNFLIFSARKTAAVVGFVWEGERLLKFAENPAGKHIVLSCLCGFESWPPDNRFGLPHFNAIYLPKAGLRDSSRSFLPEARAGDPQSAVVTSVLTREEFESRRNVLFSRCKQLEAISGTLDEINADTLLLRLHKTDQPIRFYRALDDIVVPRLKTTTLSRESINMEDIRLAYAGAAIKGKALKTIITAPEAWSFAASIPMPARNFPDSYTWIYLRTKVTKGQIGFGILDQTKGTFLTRRFVEQGEDFETIYLPLRAAQAAGSLIIENGAWPASSQVIIQDVGVITAKDSGPTRLGSSAGASINAVHIQ